MQIVRWWWVVWLGWVGVASAAPTSWVRYAGGDGVGKGRHVVLIAGDEEYRSEESMPMLGRILAERHGFDCSVLFSVSADGFIDPNAQQSLTHPEALDSADVIVMLIRFRRWPDEVMAKLAAAMRRGVPVVGLRTSTHAFRFPKGSPNEHWNQWGKEVLGEQWVSHWGNHRVEATRGVIETAHASHPVMRGVERVFGNSDVYEVAPPSDAIVLMRGQVLQGMQPDDPPAEYRKSTKSGVEQPVNDPMMPVAWVRELPTLAGGLQRVVCLTMGAATDLQCEGLRRLVVNGVLWCQHLEVPDAADVAIVGSFQPLMYGENGFRTNVRPSAHAK